jgi:hypothetical protein
MAIEDDRPPAPPMQSAPVAPSAPVRQANAVIPREALERVLARAVELQTVHEELPDGISEARLVEIAKEVGIDVPNLRQAMAEERARLPLTEEEHGFMLDALGPGSASAQRTVPGTPSEISAKLDAWMPRMELLAMRRKVGDHTSWEPKRDPLGNFLRNFGVGGRRMDLVRSDQVSAMVTTVDGTKSVVRLESAMYGARRAQRTVFSVLATGLVLGFSLLSIPIWLLASSGAVPVIAITLLAAVFGGTGYGLWRTMRRSYRQLVGRAQLRLEQLLDELEGGGMRPASGGLLHQVRDALLGKP